MIMQHNYYIYIVSNTNNRVVYIGVTSDLVHRIKEHKNKIYDGFTRRYNVDRLVYYEHFDNINRAINREKQLKGWTRAKKNQLIAGMNPNWDDLSCIFGE